MMAAGLTYNDSLEHFEEELARFIGVKHAIVTGSGRSALELILESFKLEGRPFLCSCLTCSIVPQTIIKAGAFPYFVDICENLSMNKDHIKENLPSNCSGVLLNYLYGCPADSIKEVMEYARQKEILVIEDVAQSFGAEIGNQRAGSFGDAALFSFPKIFFPLYRGGYAATNRTDIAEKMRLLRDSLQSKPILTSIIKNNFKKKLAKSLKKFNASEIPFYTQSEKWGSSPYYYFEPTYSYQYWNLTDNEINKCLDTLRSFNYLKKIRLDLVKKILNEIEQKWEGVIRPIFDYKKEYVYSRIPVIVEPSHYTKMQTFLRSHRTPIWMNYRPLCNNKLFSSNSVLCGSCEKSNYISQYLIPLPVDTQMFRSLEEGTTTNWKL